MSKHLTSYQKRIDELVKDNPLSKAIRSQTREDVIRSLEELGIMKDGKVLESFKKKFTGSHAPNNYCPNPAALKQNDDNPQKNTANEAASSHKEKD